MQTSVAMDDGVNIRAIGSDMKPGELVIQAGDKIGPSEIGLLATLGMILLSRRSEHVPSRWALL